MSTEIFTKLTDKYPFITLCLYASQEYVGIIQNRDDVITTIYDFGSITDLEAKKLFLELANIWWWESMIIRRILRVLDKKKTVN